MSPTAIRKAAGSPDVNAVTQPLIACLTASEAPADARPGHGEPESHESFATGACGIRDGDEIADAPPRGSSATCTETVYALPSESVTVNVSTDESQPTAGFPWASNGAGVRTAPSQDAIFPPSSGGDSCVSHAWTARVAASRPGDDVTMFDVDAVVVAWPLRDRTAAVVITDSGVVSSAIHKMTRFARPPIVIGSRGGFSGFESKSKPQASSAGVDMLHPFKRVPGGRCDREIAVFGQQVKHR